MKKVLFIKNAIVLTVTALVLRLAGIIFKVWLAARIGSEGIGLYQLVLSIYVLASAFASSGVSTAVTRLVTDELAIGSGKGALRVLKKGIVVSLLIALVTLGITYFGADFIAERILSDIRAADALRVLGFSLPFMGVSSCVRGYFIARRKTMSSGLSQMLEQAVRIIIVVMLAGSFAKHGLSFACAAVMLGDTAAEALSCLFLCLSLRLDTKKIKSKLGKKLQSGYRKIIGIALPITAGRYLNSGLRTTENIIVPKNLALFGGADTSLSQFGMIKGMALPLLFFPSSFLNSVSTLLIPEMSEALARGQKYKIRYATEKVMTLTSVSAFWLAAVFFALAQPLGVLIYKSSEVGALLRALSPIVPLMYIDSVCDGMLKGLDQQRFVFRVSVSDSVLRLLLIPFIVPNMGMTGFLIIMVLSNLYTAVLRIFKLLKLAEMPFDVSRWLIKPLVCAVLSVGGTVLAVNKFVKGPLLSVLITLAISLALYVLFAVISRCVSRDDVRDLF